MLQHLRPRAPGPSAGRWKSTELVEIGNERVVDVGCVVGLMAVESGRVFELCEE